MLITLIGLPIIRHGKNGILVFCQFVRNVVMP